MKVAIKYGLIITAGLIVWVVVAHTLFPNPQSPVHSFGAMTFFNLLHFIVLFLGLRAFEREQGKQSFKDLLKTGVSISFVYAVTAALFFVGVLMVIGPKWLGSRPEVEELAPGLVAVQAFAGLVIATMVLGLIYSTLVAFVLAKRS